jgi:hypothetical protein
MACPGNPCDGQTLEQELSQVERIARVPEHVPVNNGYRGAGCEGNFQVHADELRRGRTAKAQKYFYK